MQELVSAISLGSIYLLFALGMSLDLGHDRHPELRPRGDLHVLGLHRVTWCSARRAAGLSCVVLVGSSVGAALSLLIQVLAFEPILKRARTKRAAEMQILIGGIGSPTIPLAIAQQHDQATRSGSAAHFDVNVYQSSASGSPTSRSSRSSAGPSRVGRHGVWLRRSKQGLALRAIGVDAETSAGMGVNRRPLALVTMAVSGGDGRPRRRPVHLHARRDHAGER